jgi:hypothetical protein
VASNKTVSSKAKQKKEIEMMQKILALTLTSMIAMSATTAFAAPCKAISSANLTCSPPGQVRAPGYPVSINLCDNSAEKSIEILFNGRAAVSGTVTVSPGSQGTVYTLKNGADLYTINVVHASGAIVASVFENESNLGPQICK